MRLSTNHAVIVITIENTDDVPTIPNNPVPPEGSTSPRELFPFQIEVSYAPDRGTDTERDWVARQVIVMGCPPEQRGQMQGYHRAQWRGEDLANLPPWVAGVVREFTLTGTTELVLDLTEGEVAW